MRGASCSCVARGGMAGGYRVIRNGNWCACCRFSLRSTNAVSLREIHPSSFGKVALSKGETVLFVSAVFVSLPMLPLVPFSPRLPDAATTSAPHGAYPMLLCTVMPVFRKHRS